MNKHSLNKLQSLVFISALFGLAACSSTPKEPSLTEQIRARGEMRVDVAQNLDEGEAKIARAQKSAKKAVKLETDAAKAEKRANAYMEKAKKLRTESAKLKQESEKLTAEGTAQINKAVEAYQSLKELPKIALPVSSTP
ncbi:MULTISPECIES: hypothetical protein [Acinetobacter]|uniref:hypothetical protein n=1 Tax=Acinetobacter TaxID=469 RepID=UPI00124E3C86|nr:hypothetical protein [Acinetobacter brisouii]WQN52394.1 hypothetical protein U6038_16970 [Acinetobacter johnsonii]